MLSLRLKYFIFIAGAIFVCLGLVYLGGSGLASADIGIPHGDNDSANPKCAACHSGHNALGPGLLRQVSQKETCYLCHNHVKQQFGDVEDEVGSAVYSRHPVTSGDMQCTSCHNPHYSPQETARLLAAGESKVSSGNEFCGVCHGQGSQLPGGDMVTRFMGTPHDTGMTPPASGTGIKCISCHQPHGSPFDYLLRTKVKDRDGVSREVSGNDNTLCYGCHADGAGEWQGQSVYEQSKHGSTDESTVALTVYSGVNYAPGQCLNCHEPHGTGISDYKRAVDNALCTNCHDASSVHRPDSYSYRGIAVYNNTPHAGAASPTSIGSLYRPNSQALTVWEAAYYQTPSNPGSLINPIEDLPSLFKWDYSWLETGLTTTEGVYFTQMFRFKINGPVGNISELRPRWIGHSEPIAYTEFSIWNSTLNGGTGGWEKLFSGELGADLPLSAVKNVNISNYVNSSGEIYFLAVAGDSAIKTNYIELEVTRSVAPGTAGSCTSCHAVHGNSEAGKQLKGPGATGCLAGGCHSDQTKSVSKINIKERFTGGMDYTSRHSVDPFEQSERGTKVECVNCHNPHLNDAENRTVNPEVRNENLKQWVDNGISKYIGAGGEVYVLARAEHDGKAPTVKNVVYAVYGDGGSEYSALITWQTDEAVVATVSWGSTTSEYVYQKEVTTGSLDFPDWTYSVTLPDLEPDQVYWFEIKARDAVGNEGITVSRTFTTAEYFSPPYSGGGIGGLTVQPVSALNTDYLAVGIGTGDVRKYYLPDSDGSRIWESAGTGMPTIGSPGTEVTESVYGLASALDDNLFATDNTAADGEYNYQLFSFTIDESPEDISIFTVRWTGYGEPTLGYDTTVYVWNFDSGEWEQIGTKTGSGLHTGQNTFTFFRGKDNSSFCLKCHDNNPPAGVEMGTTPPVNIAETFVNDIHGDEAGTSANIAAPYTLGIGRVACDECHDPHGSSNAYHLREKVNGQVVGSGISVYGVGAESFCGSCHTGNLYDDWHQECMSCHGKGDTPPLPDRINDCFRCHGHNKSWDNNENHNFDRSF